MSRLIINNFNEFAQHIGQELGVSDYLTITQEQIDLFADATLDHQWIHVDTVHIPADTRSAFPVISVQSPVSIQCCWQS